jgi:hypothetical protein
MDTYTFKLNREQIGIIAAALGELPHKISRGVIDALQEQIDKADAVKKAAAPAAN